MSRAPPKTQAIQCRSSTSSRNCGRHPAPGSCWDVTNIQRAFYAPTHFSTKQGLVPSLLCQISRPVTGAIRSMGTSPTALSLFTRLITVKGSLVPLMLEASLSMSDRDWKTLGALWPVMHIRKLRSNPRALNAVKGETEMRRSWSQEGMRVWAQQREAWWNAHCRLRDLRVTCLPAGIPKPLCHFLAGWRQAAPHPLQTSSVARG